MTGAQLRFRATLMHDAHVIQPLVLVAQLFEGKLGFGVAIIRLAGELVGDGEPEIAPRELILRIDGENVEADRFCFLWLVQKAIAFGLVVGLFNAGWCDALRLVIHKSYFAPMILRTIFSTGS